MSLKPFLALCRISNLPTVWMNVLTAMVLIEQATTANLEWVWFGLFVLALSAFYCGGMVMNDLFDYKWDKQYQPYRPLVAGGVTLPQAIGVALVLFAVGFLIIGFAPFSFSGLVAAISLFVTILIYNAFHKKTAACVAVMGLARALIFVVVLMAYADQWLWWVLVAAAVQFGYTLLLTFVARHEHTRGKPYQGPVIPRMIAAMAIIDGCLLACVVAPLWLLPGVALAIMTRFGQRYIRGD